MIQAACSEPSIKTEFVWAHSAHGKSISPHFFTSWHHKAISFIFPDLHVVSPDFGTSW